MQNYKQDLQLFSLSIPFHRYNRRNNDDVLLVCGVRGFRFQIDTVYLRLNRFEYISARDFATPSCVLQRGCRNVTVQQMMSSALRSAEAQQRWIA